MFYNDLNLYVDAGKCSVQPNTFSRCNQFDKTLVIKANVHRIEPRVGDEKNVSIPSRSLNV